jgi:hypothetical protein
MRVKQPRRVSCLTGGAAIAVLVVGAGSQVAGRASAAPGPAAVLATFSTPGYYSWTVPAGIKQVVIDAYGASGGNVSNGAILVSVGGTGGEARGQFAVKPGQVYEIAVGGRGGDNRGDLFGNVGVNGGGPGSGAASPGALGGAGGGGGSDVRIGGFGNACAAAHQCGVRDRIIAAGGGGGGGSETASNGGAGGGPSGASAGDGRGGSAEYDPGPCPDPAGASYGCFGYGGYASIPTTGGGGGGGGGGWAGGDGDTQLRGRAGSGGCGFVSHYAKKPAFPGGTRGGDGLVVISTP